MPGWPIGNKTIPSGCAPAFHKPVLFQYDMADVMRGKMCAHRKTSLTSANNNCIGLFQITPHRTYSQPNCLSPIASARLLLIKK
jgi:hypothetical protein